MSKKEIIFRVPKIYNNKVKEAQNLKEKDPILFIESFCNLTGLKKAIIIHKSLKFAAEFEFPNKIYLDFSNSLNYISLCIAHEYSHLLIRNKINLPYPIEQSLAILLQLEYEDFANIRKFKRENAKELLILMNVWESGRFILKKWDEYNPNNKDFNIIDWVKKNLKESNLE